MDGKLHVEVMLSIREAAAILNVSKRFVVGLLDGGAMPCVGEGAFRKVMDRDLIAYKAKRDAECRQAMDDLTELSQEMGLY